MSVSFHPEVVERAKEEDRKTVRKERRWVDGNEVNSFYKFIFLWLVLTFRCQGVLGVFYQQSKI